MIERQFPSHDAKPFRVRPDAAIALACASFLLLSLLLSFPGLARDSSSVALPGPDMRPLGESGSSVIIEEIFTVAAKPVNYTLSLPDALPIQPVAAAAAYQ